MQKFGSAISPEIEQKLAELRERKKLSPVSSEQEGTPLASLPDNVVGFTYSPANESTPLYAKRTFQSFEIHKLTDGVAHLIGFVTDAQAAAIYDGKEPTEVNLYPEPYGESTRLIEIPLERIRRAKPPSRSDGNYTQLQLDPAAD